MKVLEVGALISIALLFTAAFCVVWVVLAFMTYQKYKNVNITVDAAYKIQNALTALANINFFVILLCIVLMVALSDLPKFASLTIGLSVVVLVLAFLAQLFIFIIQFNEVLASLLINVAAGQTLNITGKTLFGESIYAILAVTIVNTILALVIVVYAFRGKKQSANVAAVEESTQELEQTVQDTSVDRYSFYPTAQQQSTTLYQQQAQAPSAYAYPLQVYPGVSQTVAAQAAAQAQTRGVNLVSPSRYLQQVAQLPPLQQAAPRPVRTF